MNSELAKSSVLTKNPVLAKCALFLCLAFALISLPLKAETLAAPDAYQTLFSQSADTAQLVALSKKLNLGETVRGQFVQSRQLKVLKKPLISQGQFIFDQTQGLIWQQIKPFESLLILKDKQLIQRDSQGRVQVSKADASASAAAMGDLLPNLVRAMLGGDISGLSENFELHFLITDRLSPDGQWQLGLTPKDPLMKKAIANMVLEGGDVLQSLVLLSAAPNVTSQDMTRIDFSALSQGTLSETELAQYALALEASKP
ncbi:outer membrane lipoprotein carrier protein LolA [Shewanella baltica]|uniref:outer membrane lipoprotein carrier protein LolA n=1 Tax=Shewanella baltica TaxID=62322 RepID=UPI00217D9757|nr:outer membrane lipoprotein carrier protein LolA [Shewanella baltica]MCS6101557.1 outer membrane lipoprotein carrier protein LolA [Shewanella baltica]MCS6183695.1 outer membrane lipoprotein carrier protein LolA [Shewanella baltica]